MAEIMTNIEEELVLKNKRLTKTLSLANGKLKDADERCSELDKRNNDLEKKIKSLEAKLNESETRCSEWQKKYYELEQNNVGLNIRIKNKVESISPDAPNGKKKDLNNSLTCLIRWAFKINRITEVKNCDMEKATKFIDDTISKIIELRTQSEGEINK